MMGTAEIIDMIPDPMLKFMAAQTGADYKVHKLKREKRRSPPATTL